MNLEEMAAELLRRLDSQRSRALLLGEEPEDQTLFEYVRQQPYEAVVIGQISAGAMLHMPDEAVCQALLDGVPVYLTTQRWNAAHARILCRELAAAQQHLKQLGVRELGTTRSVITAEEARRMLQSGAVLPDKRRMTPLARDILEGKAP